MSTEATKPTAKRWKVAKGGALSIPGVKILITDQNVNNPNIITIISNQEKLTGRQYFGKTIVQG